MAQIHVDPKAQVEFARFLHEAVNRIRVRHEDVGRQLRELNASGVWRDGNYDDYHRKFSTATANIEELVKNAGHFCQYLQSQAAKGEAYLRLRGRLG